MVKNTILISKAYYMLLVIPLFFCFFSAFATEFILSDKSKKGDSSNFKINSKAEVRMKNIRLFSVQLKDDEVEDFLESEVQKEGEDVIKEGNNSLDLGEFDMSQYISIKKELKDFRNFVVVLFFWVPWGMDSILELQELNNLSKIITELELNDKVLFVPIAVLNSPDISAILKVYNNYKISNLDVFYIEDRVLLNDFDFKVFPRSFVLDKKGFEISKSFSGVNWSNSSVVDYIKLIVKRNFK